MNIEKLSKEYSKELEKIKTRKFDIDEIKIKTGTIYIEYVIKFKNHEGYEVKVDTEYNSFSVKKDDCSFGETLDDDIIEDLLSKAKESNYLIDQDSLELAYNFKLAELEELSKMKIEH